MYNKYYIKDNSYLIFAHKFSDHLLGILPNEKNPTLYTEVTKFISNMKENNVGRKPNLWTKT